MFLTINYIDITTKFLTIIYTDITRKSLTLNYTDITRKRPERAVNYPPHPLCSPPVPS